MKNHPSKFTQIIFGIGEDFPEADFRLYYVSQFKLMIRLAILSGICLYVLFFAWDYMHDPDDMLIKFILRFGLMFLGFFLLLFTLFRIYDQYHQLLMSIFILYAGFGVCGILFTTPDGFLIGIAGILLVLMYATGFLRLFLMNVIICVLAIVIFANILMFIQNSPISDQALIEVASANFFMISAGSIAMLLAYFIEAAERRAFLFKMKFEDQLEKSERTLMRFVPERLMQRVVNGERYIAEAHSEVTILFADIVGFTDLTNKLSPGHMVEILNEIFDDLDLLASEYHLETVKTIGDAYMVAGLGKVDDVDGANRIVDFAKLAMLRSRQYAADKNPPIELRMGISTGAVISGVIGKNKPSYDYWGRCVNEASRLETNGTPSTILISESTRWRVAGRNQIEEFGPVSINDNTSVMAYKVDWRDGPEGMDETLKLVKG